MKLPASLLSHLRVSIAAGAVVATGCDLAAADEAPEAAQAPAAAAETPETRRAESAQAHAKPDPSGVAAVARAAAQESPRVIESTPIDEDPTAVVPFSSGTEPSGPSRVKPREEAPLAFADPPPKRPKPRVKRPKPRPKPVVGKGWDNCPACGRG